MSIYVTGDTHGHIDISKLSFKNWPHGKTLTKKDYVIICGDFGLVFRNEQSKDEKYWIQWLVDRPWTTLFVDGNHENHPKLKELKTIKMFGSEVGKVARSVFHLRRGHIYNIDGNTFLAFGGASSIDRELREEGKSWWPDEVPSEEEFHTAMNNLDETDGKVDYILAHTLPYEIQIILGLSRIKDKTTAYLNHIINRIGFKKFYCGHFHIDKSFGKFNLLYNSILEICS